MKKRGFENKEDEEFRRKVDEFLKSFNGKKEDLETIKRKKEVLDTIEVGLSIEIVKLSWTEENSDDVTETLCAYVSRSDEIDSEPIVSFFFNPPVEFSDFVCDDIYLTLSEALITYGKDIVRESFANAVKDMTGKYPKDYVKVVRQIYGNPLDNSFIKGDLRGGKDPKADLSSLSQHYDKVRAIWIEAADLYNTIMRSKHSYRKKEWMEDIKNAFSDLPEDLILRLQPFSEYPIELATICSEKGGMNDPEDIALEHAAQLCGAEPYTFKLSSLKSKLKKQKRDLKTRNKTPRH